AAPADRRPRAAPRRARPARSDLVLPPPACGSARARARGTVAASALLAPPSGGLVRRLGREPRGLARPAGLRRGARAPGAPRARARDALSRRAPPLDADRRSGAARAPRPRQAGGARSSRPRRRRRPLRDAPRDRAAVRP